MKEQGQKQFLQLAEDRDRLNKRLIEAGKSETEAQRIGASTGFRTHAARYDASQEVNVTELGGHRFNTAGNRDLKLPTLELVPPVEPVPKAETLVEGETVSAAPEGVTREIAQQEDEDMSPDTCSLALGWYGSARATKTNNRWRSNYKSISTFGW